MADWLSMDIGIGAFFSTLTLMLLFSIFFLLTDTYSTQLSLIEKERLAIRISNQLLYTCISEMGLAECDDVFIEANRLSKDSINLLASLSQSELKEYMRIHNEADLRIRIITDSGEWTLMNSVGSEKICIKRIISLEEEIGVLEVCVS